MMFVIFVSSYATTNCAEHAVMDHMTGNAARNTSADTADSPGGLSRGNAKTACQ